MDPRLTTLYRAFANDDPPPNRVKPMPIQILHKAQHTATQLGDAYNLAICDMAWIAFFFLLRPGEYCKSPDNTPIALQDITFTIGHQRLNPMTCPLHLLQRATHVSITFQQQKNHERGEVIAHGRSGHSIACPTLALTRRITYLCQHPRTAPTTALCTWYTNTNRPSLLSSNNLTSALRDATDSLPNLGFSSSDVNARSLRAGGAMALLCGRIDRDTIQLVGRWKSNAMFR